MDTTEAASSNSAAINPLASLSRFTMSMSSLPRFGKRNNIENYENDSEEENNDLNESKQNNIDKLEFVDAMKTYLDRLEKNQDIIEIICLFNSKSGGGKSWVICNEFAKYNVTLFDMYDLSKEEKMQEKLGKLIYDCQKVLRKDCIIAICGGDGAYSWGVNFLIDKCLNKAKSFYNVDSISFPSILTVPAGTGNDLSRVIGWGNNQLNIKDSISFISNIHFCSQIAKRYSMLDRWNVKINFIDELTKYKEKNNNLLKNENKNDESNNDDTLYEKIFLEKQFTYDPPLPQSFVSYLSVGYDAMTAYTYEQDRKQNRNRFSGQNMNGLMYVKHGIGEFFIQSEPLNKKIKLTVNGKEIELINNCRSCKLVNINSAIGGIFFWGNAKSHKNELQSWTPPQLGDGKIEVMATRGVHSMLAHRVNIAHAHRISQSDDIKLEILETPLALQMDGEAWLVKEKMVLNVTLKDKVPIIVGCNTPHGVDQIYETKLYPKERQYFESKMKSIFHVSDNDSNSNKQQQSIDESNVETKLDNQNKDNLQNNERNNGNGNNFMLGKTWNMNNLFPNASSLSLNSVFRKSEA